MNISKIKPILPSLREKKRYVKYEVISKSKLSLSKEDVEEGIMASIKNLVGELGMAESGSKVLKKSSNEKNGVIVVNSKFVDYVRAALLFITMIKNSPVMVRCVGVSGMINKVQKMEGGL